MKHNWKFDGISIHNNEYWYKCELCGATDWIASYGTEDQLLPKECNDRFIVAKIQLDDTSHA